MVVLTLGFLEGGAHVGLIDAYCGSNMCQRFPKCQNFTERFAEIDMLIGPVNPRR